MKKLTLIILFFVPFISFTQTNKDSIEVTILSETNNLYVKSNYFEGVVFVWDENDTLFWTPSTEDIIMIEIYIKELFDVEKTGMWYYDQLSYYDLSNYKRQYIGQYYIGSKNKYLWISLIKNGSETLQNNIWKEKPLYIIGGEPVYLSLDFNFEDILNNNFEYE